MLRNILMWGTIVLLLSALYSIYWRGHRPRAASKNRLVEGKELVASISLVSTDFKALACASAEEIDGRHCFLSTPKERWIKPSSTGRPDHDATFAPYRTTDDELVLITDALWDEPALQERLKIDPPQFGVEHARFNANCKLKIVGKMPKVQVRWEPAGKFFENSNVPVGTVSACTAAEP